MKRILRSLRVVIDVDPAETGDETATRLETAIRTGGMAGFGVDHEPERDEVIDDVTAVDVVFAAGTAIWSHGLRIGG